MRVRLIKHDGPNFGAQGLYKTNKGQAKAMVFHDQLKLEQKNLEQWHIIS